MFAFKVNLKDEGLINDQFFTYVWARNETEAQMVAKGKFPDATVINVEGGMDVNDKKTYCKRTKRT